ncbi:hypothetical protein BDD12DRAFT_898943 [Trichophaea hybrida]|nr:hypothetical protein BDD12DRAFT_898943 [Trichophaea hybrida]
MRKPDLIVGVDFGMSETGVAFAGQSRALHDTHAYKKWNGRRAENSNKVPTWLIYNSRQSQDSAGNNTLAPQLWGFQCVSNQELEIEDEDEGVEDRDVDSRRWFKVLLDPKILGKMGTDAPGTHEDVKRWIKDFLQCIYEELVGYFERTTLLAPNTWASSKIEFIFSVPTTWENHTMIDDFKHLVKDAGFGEGGKDHTAVIGLTEASAAAVYTFRTWSEPQTKAAKNNCFIICDCGGGTSDISLLRVVEASDKKMALKELLPVKGIPVGSTNIDDDFRDYVHNGLHLGDQCIANRCMYKRAAKKMSESQKFQVYKCTFGEPKHTEFTSFSYQESRIDLRHGEMATIFDRWINQIISLLNDQVGQLHGKDKQRKISYLILSGGLGTNEYLHQRLQTWQESNRSRFPAIRNLRILKSDEPQLAVAKGLVMDRIETYEHRQSFLLSQCCRSNYGIICSREYNKQKHKGLPVWKSEFDGKSYVSGQIDWIVKKGCAISNNDPILHKFFRYFECDKPVTSLKWYDEVVKTDLAIPPDRMTDGVQNVCKIPVEFSQKDIESFAGLSKDKWWSRGKKKYFRVDYDAKIFFGPADISIEIWQNGRNYSESRPIEVEFEPMPLTHSEREPVAMP